MKEPRLIEPRRISPSIPSEEAARIEALFLSIGDGAIATDAAGRITHINKVALRLLGYRKAEVLNKRFGEKIIAVYDNGQLMESVDRPIARAFQTGKPVTQRTIYRRNDGKLLPVQLTVAPVVFAGKPIGAVEVFRDITAEVAHEKLTSDFITVASHQLRTPLTSINVFAKMLEDGMAGDMNALQSVYITNITTAVRRMNALINTLLNITRIEAGGVTVQPRTVDIRLLIKEVLAEIAPPAAQKELHMVCHLDMDLESIKTDELLIKEVLLNLLTNAIKYTPVQGTITVTVAEDSSNVVFSVHDTGIGIPRKDHKYIFTKFFRADNASSVEVTGTGLGLYLAKTLAEQLGGDLWFKSAEHQGSTFYFSLPKSGSIDRPGGFKLSTEGGLF